MKRKEFAIANLIIAALILTSGALAFNLSVNPNPVSDNSVQNLSSAQKKNGASCSNQAPLKIVPGGDANLERLKEYQDVCSSYVTNKMMVFTTFAQDDASAAAAAASLAHTLKQFKQSGVTPLVVAEPYITGGAMSYQNYLAGNYDSGMDAFFQHLQADGVTNDMIGTWVPFPESNVPGWNNIGTEPHDFALCVNKYLTLLKQYYPSAQGTILLSATTYQPDDINWNNGDYESLSPYVDGIDSKLVTSVGIEGFPWMSNAQQTKRTIFSASEFLQPDLAIGMAQVLHTRDIWINTGTFASKYTNDPSKTVTLTVAEREEILSDILSVAVNNVQNYNENQYRVSINLFSEDKSNTDEATDWSYFQNSESQAALKSFLSQAHADGIPVSISDKTK